MEAYAKLLVAVDSPLIRQYVTHLRAHSNGTQKEPTDFAEKLLQVLNSPLITQEAHRQFLKWLPVYFP